MHHREFQKNSALDEVLAGGLALMRWNPELSHNEISELCTILQGRNHLRAWATTPWGRSMPRSCVGTSPIAYRRKLAIQPNALISKLNKLFYAPVAEEFSKIFNLPITPLKCKEGMHIPTWALREMADGGFISEHCEQDWNSVNLIENNRILKINFDPRFHMSFLYCINNASKGGELELTKTKTVLTMKPRELVLFNAGLYKHQILPTSGPNNRVVLGGFLRLNANHKHLHCYV